MNGRFLLGVAMLVVAAVIVGMLWPQPPLPPGTTPAAAPPRSTPTPVSVKGLGGGSKAPLLNDPEVVRILRERYGISKPDYRSMGSLEQCDENLNGLDFVWPGNELAVERCKQNLHGAIDAEVIFHSPIVFYSWEQVTTALQGRGLIEQQGGVWYISDMPQFVKLVSDGPEWRTLGLPDLNGRMLVKVTDPTKSNSGNIFGAMMAEMLLGNEVPNESTLPPVLPKLAAYFIRSGYLPPSTGGIFRDCTHMGYGACPIFVGYESQMLEYLVQNSGEHDDILKKVRIIYPRPTEWGSHALIALTSNGKRLQTALLDGDIQALACQQHGFRTGVFHTKDCPAYDFVPPEIVSVLQLPRPAVMDQMTLYLDDALNKKAK